MPYKISTAVIFLLFTFQGANDIMAQTNVLYPKKSIVEPEIRNKGKFNYVLSGISPVSDRTAREIKSENGAIYEWATPTSTLGAQYGAAKDVDTTNGAVWRLTEVESELNPKTKKRTFFATTTTFYNHGVRSKTQCIGGDGHANCVTASRKFCESFRNRSKAIELESNITIDLNDEGTIANIRNLGRQCSDFASYLDRTLDPTKTLTGPERSERDENVVAKDLAAISNVKKALRSPEARDIEIKGLDGWFGPNDKAGASVSAMKNRADRLKDIGNDFRAMAELASTCAETTFVEQGPGAGWSKSPEPRSAAPKPSAR